MAALYPMISMIALAVLSAEPPVRLLSLVKAEGAKPETFVGFPLEVTDGVTVTADGRETPVDRQAAELDADTRSAGYPSVAVGPGASLRWRLEEPPGDEFYLYFLVRTGHQRGYEYVSPDMTYVVHVNGEPVQMAPVTEVPAVRAYQSAAGWGHDLGWIRSAEKVALKAGDALTIGCSEKYAFVCEGLLVSDAADRLARLLGGIRRSEGRLADAEELLTKVAETFPTDAVRRASEDAGDDTRALRERADALRAAVAETAKRIESGAEPDVAPLAKTAADLARDLATVEGELAQDMTKALRPVLRSLSKGIEGIREDSRTYWARDALYARGVAERYARAAGSLLDPPFDMTRLRKAATYLWRADQFIRRADDARQKIADAPARLPVERPAVARGGARGSVLLNGEWEMSTEGAPDSPPEGGWFKIRVPHGPWRETVGRFMALDRKWPDGQHWAWYRVSFPVPEDWAGTPLSLRFDAVFHLCEVYVNGRYCGRHVGGFDAFEVNITDAARPGTNELLCFVYDTSYTALEKSDRPGEPRGNSSGPNHYVISDLWGARFGGIWQNVSLVARPAVRVRDVFVVTSVRKRRLSVETTVASGVPKPEDVRLRQEVVRDGKTVLTLRARRVRLSGAGEKTVKAEEAWPDPQLWGIGGKYGDPSNLYFLKTTLLDGRGKVLDTHYQRFGFREFWIEDGQFWLNGERFPLQGGGTWYLQEGKAPHGNRWFGLQFFKTERAMGVNIERWHRHGDVADEFFDLADELGVMNEPEGPYWGCYGVPDILGISDWDDPVWVENVSEHYRRWARKHRNHPSIAIWSIENETFTSTQRPPGMFDRFLSFGDALQSVDPTRPVTYHGSENGRHADGEPRVEIINLHYPNNNRVKDWKTKWGGRPTINGEFQNYPALFYTTNKDPKVAAENMRKLQDWIEATWGYYREIELSGAMYFLPYMAGLVSTAKPEWMGPWGDLFPPLAEARETTSGWRAGSASLSAEVPITWPSLSGPGIKCERLITGLGNRSLINWFDPSRPAATPTPVAETLRKSWDPMPPLSPRKAPEVIVTVTRAGQPAPCVAVVARPLDGQCTSPFGAMTDPAGTAWLVFKEPGRYELECNGKKLVFKAKWGQTDAGPGYGDVPLVTLDL